MNARIFVIWSVVVAMLALTTTGCGSQTVTASAVGKSAASPRAVFEAWENKVHADERQADPKVFREDVAQRFLGKPGSFLVFMYFKEQVMDSSVLNLDQMPPLKRVCYEGLMKAPQKTPGQLEQLAEHLQSDSFSDPSLRPYLAQVKLALRKP